MEARRIMPQASDSVSTLAEGGEEETAVQDQEQQDYRKLAPFRIAVFKGGGQLKKSIEWNLSHLCPRSGTTRLRVKVIDN